MRLFIIFIALVIAVAAGVGFWLVSQDGTPESSVVQQPQQPQQVAVPEQTILIARQDIPVGKKIDENDIDRQVWPAHLVHPDFIPDGGEAGVVDKVARTAFKQGQPLMNSFLANPNDPGFLAAQLPEGMRAVTIAVDAITGVNGFVFPGDRVDVIVSHSVGLEQDFRHENQPSLIQGAPPQQAVTVQRLPRRSSYSVPLLMTDSKRSARPKIDLTEVLLPNIRVLAVGMTAAQYEGAVAVPTNVTLEVNEQQAQMLRHVDPGTISLSLRSLKDIDNMNVPRPTADADITNIIPPAYFPYLYKKGDYAVEALSLEEVDYDSAQDDGAPEAEKGHIAIIRGVEKEIVGVERP